MIYSRDKRNGGHLEHVMKKYTFSLRHQINVVFFYIVIILASRAYNVVVVPCLKDKSLSYKWIASILKQF